MKIKPSILALALIPYFASAQNYEIGSRTTLGSQIFDEVIPFQKDTKWNSTDRVYVNTFSPEVQTEEVLSAIKKGAIVVLDNSNAATPEKIEEKTMKIIGIGFKSPIIVAAKRNGRMSVTLVQTESNISKIRTNLEKEAGPIRQYQPEELSEKIDNEDIIRGINEAINDYQKDEFTLHPQVITNYLPEKSIDVNVARRFGSCELHASRDLDDNKLMNYCDDSKGATMNLRYNISMIRSVRAVKEGGGHTKNAKFLRISISTENGAGAGLHINDYLRNENAWYQSNANRTTRTGPFAEKYSFWIHHVGGSTPTLVSHSPENKNPEYTHTEKNAVSIGVNGKLSANIGDKGPSGGAEIGLSYATTHERTMSWKTREYKIINKSSGTSFDIDWVRSLNQCQELYRDQGGCLFTEGWAGGGMVFNTAKFNSLAHSNFIPNFDVLYEMPVSEKGISRFTINSRMTPKVRFGEVFPQPLFFSSYHPAGWSARDLGTQDQVTVNWNHPIFEPEAHVKLRAMFMNNACLHPVGWSSAPGTKVNTISCEHTNNAMLWGLDTKERYRSRSGDNACLTANLTNGSLTLEECNEGLNQKWFWQGDKLYSRVVTSNNKNYMMKVKNPEWTGSEIIMVPDGDIPEYQTKWRNELNLPQ